MDTAASRVTKYIRAERERRKWSQADLALAAGNISRTTVANLERGTRLREGKESAIEAALGWQLGSLDAIRNGGQPTVVGGTGDLYERGDPRDEVEEAIMSFEDASKERRWQAIFRHRRKLLAKEQQKVDEGSPFGQTGE